MPKAEYFSYQDYLTISHVLEGLEDELETALKALREGRKADLYHALNDLCGSFSEASSEFGYFHQIFEEYF